MFWAQFHNFIDFLTSRYLLFSWKYFLSAIYPFYNPVYCVFFIKDYSRPNFFETIWKLFLILLLLSNQRPQIGIQLLSGSLNFEFSQRKGRILSHFNKVSYGYVKFFQGLFLKMEKENRWESVNFLVIFFTSFTPNPT